MKFNKISLIMPCYNCTPTLREAFDSIYRQNFTIPFEVILVDDGSTDGTVELITELITSKPECIFLQHEINKGGGAARNTAIAKSTGDVFFCLDSDDILADNSIQPMIDFMQTHDLDGTIFETRSYFYTDVHKARKDVNPKTERDLSLTDLFAPSETRITFNNFVYTKHAYEVVGGYPEHHGFDSQQFEFTFLARKLRSRIAPGSNYFHRQALKRHSYFQREYEKGAFSINILLALEPSFEHLHDEVLKRCIEFPIFSSNDFRNGDNLLEQLRSYYAEHSNTFLKSDDLPRSAICIDIINASQALLEHRYADAKVANNALAAQFETTPQTLTFYDLRADHGLAGTEPRLVEAKTIDWLYTAGMLHRRKMRWLPPWLVQVYKLCKSIVRRS